MLKNIYISGGMRTPFGSFHGSLADMTAAQLGAHAGRATIAKTGIDPKEIDEVLFGNVLSAGLGQNVARQIALGSGLPNNVGATSVNKVCGSSLKTAVLAAQVIQCGDAGVILAGGAESMTNAPYLLPKARSGYRMGNGELIDAMIHDGLWDVYTNRHMGTCGDQCVSKYGFSRKDQDTYSVESYVRANRAAKAGLFSEEISPIEIKTRRETIVVDADEDVAKFRGENALRALRPAFGKDSTITAGNASSINDGAASMIVFDDDRKNALGLEPEAKIVGYANAALESDWFTIAPIYAIQSLCEKLRVTPRDVDLFEINEAFAVVSMVAIKELKLDHTRVNINGGAVALGHPIGATGARLINTLARSLIRENKTLGIACACIGGGEALAVAIERC